MATRYDYVLDGFYNRGVFYIRDVHLGASLGDVDKDASAILQGVVSNLEKLHDNPDSKLDDVKVKASWFVANKNYRAYYAFVELYNSLVYYYRYDAEHNLKNDRLENAWREWNRVLNPKQSNLSFLVSEIVRKRQK